MTAGRALKLTTWPMVHRDALPFATVGLISLASLCLKAEVVDFQERSQVGLLPTWAPVVAVEIY
jgi:hypothetical protein